MHLKGIRDETVAKIFPSDIILSGYMGSISHGTYIPTKDPHGIDDKDVMAVYVKEAPYYIGLGRGPDVREHKIEEWDIVEYEVRKFIHLLLKSNLNVLGLLWLPDNLYLIRTDMGELLIQNRNAFSSRQAYHSFTGYAYGQLKRMEHYKFEGYMGDKRKSLVDKFGYDTKNAAHLIRLLRMSIEFLTDGELYVLREDACQLISIENGEWTLSQVKTEADYLFRKANDAYIRSLLPLHPNTEMAEQLLMTIIKNWVLV